AEEKAKAAQAERARGVFAPKGPAGIRRDGAAAPGEDDDKGSYRDRIKKAPARAPRNLDRRNSGKLTVAKVLSDDFGQDRGPSLAAQKRAREKARKLAGPKEAAQKVY